ncbi:MAG: MarR family transcriptional regulator [Nocardioides sp.]|uniref:MarR family winged helix-turn-helix transcriptional regulator n=1 Tax=Nocardioides sp. TaxID=35761 RepID=UPI0039E2EE09
MTEEPSTGPSILYQVKRLELVVRARLDEALRGSGVTTLQYTALTVLAREHGVTAAALARNSFVTPQSMADMLKPLERRGLIRREPNPNSGREVLVYLSDAGREFLIDHEARVSELARQMVADLSPAEIATFRSALHRAWEALR